MISILLFIAPVSVPLWNMVVVIMTFEIEAETDKMFYSAGFLG